METIFTCKVSHVFYFFTIPRVCPDLPVGLLRYCTASQFFHLMTNSTRSWLSKQNQKQNVFFSNGLIVAAEAYLPLLAESKCAFMNRNKFNASSLFVASIVAQATCTIPLMLGCKTVCAKSCAIAFALWNAAWNLSTSWSSLLLLVHSLIWWNWWGQWPKYTTTVIFNLVNEIDCMLVPNEARITL
jgi:hypothetical protein